MNKLLIRFLSVVIISFILCTILLSTESFTYYADTISNWIQTTILIFRKSFLLYFIIIVIFNCLSFFAFYLSDQKMIQAIKKLQTNINTIFKNSSLIMFNCDRNGIITEIKCSDALKEKFDIEENEKIQNQEINRYLNESIKENKVINSVILVDENYFSLICSPLEEGYCCILLDITEQKRIMRFLKESETKFNYFANSIPDGLIEYDSRGNIIYQNLIIESILGWKPGEIKSIYELLDSEEKIKAKENSDLILKFPEEQKYKNREYDILHKNGQKVPCSITLTPRVNEFGVKILLASIRDVTIYKNQQQFLENQLEFERNISSLNKEFLEKSENFIQNSLKKVCEMIKIDEVIIFNHNCDLNKTTIEKIYHKNNFLKKEDLNKYLKIIYSNSKGASFKYFDSYNLDKFLLNIGIKSITSFEVKLRNDTILTLAFIRKNNEKAIKDTEFSTLEIYTEMLSNALGKEIFNEKIKEREDSLDALISNSIIGVMILNKRKISFVNDSLAQIFNTNKEIFLNKNIDFIYDKFPNLISIKNEYRKNFKFQRKISLLIDNKEKSIFVEIKPVNVDTVDSILITVVDLTRWGE